MKHKTQLLFDRYSLIVARKNEADAEIVELEATIESQKKEIAELKRQIEYMKFATAVAPTREAVEHSRAVLSKLVREITKCINDLNQ